MREQDVRSGRAGVDVRPRYMVWENVPGAFSSNKGEDFRIVLEETAKVADKDAVIPMPQSGKWTTSGCIVGDGWSISWRVLDAQFWGVPQRRRRIALVADFGGESAPEILFVRKGLSRDTEQSKQKRKETSPNATRSLGADDSEGEGVCTFEPGIASREGGHIYEGVSGTLRSNAGDNQMAVAYTMQDREGKAGGGKGALIAEELSATLRANNMQYLFQPIAIDMGGGKSSVDIHTDRSPTLTTTHYGEPAVAYSVENHPADSRVDIDESGKVQTLTSRMGTGGGNVPMVMQCYSKSKRAQTNTDYETWNESETANTLNAFDVGDVRTTEVIVALDRASFNQGKNAKYDFEISENGINSPIVAKGPSAVCVARAVDCRNCTEDDVNGSLQSNSAHSLNGNNVVRVKYIVRRLTPLECERLQGFPDGHTDIGEYIDTKGKKCKTSDASRYKALGNSIALPSWKFILKRLCSHYERDATMASLFDGIGGFPLLWEQINGKGSCLWASEIEEFPIAVTKERISK